MLVLSRRTALIRASHSKKSMKITRGRMVAGAHSLRMKKAIASLVRFASLCPSASFLSIAALRRKFTRHVNAVSFMRTQ